MEKKEMTATEATATKSFDVHLTAKVGNFSEGAKDLEENLNQLDVIRTKLEQDADEAYTAGLEAKSTWKKYIFDFSDRSVTKPDFLMKINGVDMFARKSLTCITGKAGQGKSQLVYLLSAAISSKRMVLGITPQRSATINIIDTEQEPWSISDKANRMLRLVGKPNFSSAPSGLTLLNLRQASSNKERLEITMDAIDELKPEVVFIDGITDMVEHIEDPDEAQRIVADLLKLIDEKGITLFVVIHQNEGTDNAKLRAFIGSELMRKASCILEVAAKNGAFEVKNTKNRSIPMPLYKFRINEMGDLTDKMVSSVQTDEGRTLEVLKSIVKARKSSIFDSKQQIYIAIGSQIGSGKNKGRTYFEKAEALNIVSLSYDGHKYKMIFPDEERVNDNN